MNVPWDMNRLAEVPEMHAAPDYAAPGVRGFFYDTLDWEGRPTRSFAWMGVPRRRDGAPVPGMVLVHGGGGTAFDGWVRLWNSRGYAAIAMDTCGALPFPESVPTGGRPRHDAAGPQGWGDFAGGDKAVADQWTYHAVADVVLAHSLLRAQQGVDPERIGMTGVSWGGYLACIAASVDARIRFAMPVYGCGFLGEDSVWKYTELAALSPERRERWLELWDPSRYLPLMDRPMCWLNGTNDFAYFMESHLKSCRLPTGPRTMCIRHEMLHGHGAAGEHPRELHVFADSLCKGEAPLACITGSGIEGRELVARYESDRPVMRADIVFTRATGYGPDRKYNVVPALLDRAQGVARVALPPETRACFLNLTDDRECVVSTELWTL